MKGYCYSVAIWLLLLLGHHVSARKVTFGTSLQSLGHPDKVPNTFAAIDLEAAKTGQHVKVITDNKAGKAAQGAQGGVAVNVGKTSQSHVQVHDHSSHKKGAEGKEKQAVVHGEEGGKKHSSEEGANHQAQHHDSKKGVAGYKFKEEDHRKKTGFSKGYHGKYHKDEYHKLDKYWKNAKENGQFQKYGEHGEHFHKEGSKHNKGTKSSKSAQAEQHGKKGKQAKGHQSSDHKGYKGHKGVEKQSGYTSQYAKKGGHSGGKQHTYKVYEK